MSGATIDDLVGGLAPVFEGNAVLVAAGLSSATQCDQMRTLALLSIAVSLKRLADAQASPAPALPAAATKVA